MDIKYTKLADVTYSKNGRDITKSPVCIVEPEPSQRNTNHILTTIPIVDSAVFAHQATKSLKQPILSKTATAFATRLGSWAGLLTAFKINDVVTKNIEKNCPKIAEKRQEHPILTLTTDVAGIYGTYALGGHLLKKGIKAIPNETKKNIAVKFKETTKKLDTSFVSKKIFKPLVKNTKSFLANHPKFDNAIKGKSKYIVPLMLAGSIVNSAIIHPLREIKKIQKFEKEVNKTQIKV